MLWGSGQSVCHPSVCAVVAFERGGKRVCVVGSMMKLVLAAARTRLLCRAADDVGSPQVLVFGGFVQPTGVVANGGAHVNSWALSVTRCLNTSMAAASLGTILATRQSWWPHLTYTFVCGQPVPPVLGE